VATWTSSEPRPDERPAGARRRAESDKPVRPSRAERVRAPSLACAASMPTKAPCPVRPRVITQTRSMSELRETWGSWDAWVLLSDFPDELLLGFFGEVPPAGAELLSPQAASARLEGWFFSGRAERLALAHVARLLGRTVAETLTQRNAVREELSASLRSGVLRLFARRMAPPIAPAPTRARTPRADATLPRALRATCSHDISGQVGGRARGSSRQHRR
jgi:hypothetical protein